MSASASPSVSPSDSPSRSPSRSPSNSPSRSPSVSPSASPSQIAASEVTYTIRDRQRIGKKYLVFVQISFGGTPSDYYNSGGIPLTLGSLGLRDTINGCVILEDNLAGYRYQWDRSANTIRMAVSATGTVDTELTTNSAIGTAIVLELMVIGW